MRRLALLLTMGLIGLSPSAFATGFIEATACPTATLSFYLDVYGGSNLCQIGGVGYSNFYFADITGAGTINQFNVMVTPNAYNSFDLMVPGGELNGTFADLERYYFAWYIDPPPVIAGDELSLDPPNAFVTASKIMCPDNTFTDTNGDAVTTLSALNPVSSTTFGCNFQGEFPGPLYFIQTAAPSPLSGSVTFGSPAATVDVRLVLDLGPGTITGFNGVGQKLPLTTDLPEPGTNTMIAAGLAAVAAFSKKKLKR